MGPVSAKTYPGEEWELGLYRAKFQPDYGRRGSIWLHGAFEPRTGEGTLLFSPSRDGATALSADRATRGRGTSAAIPDSAG